MGRGGLWVTFTGRGGVTTVSNFTIKVLVQERWMESRALFSLGTVGETRGPLLGEVTCWMLSLCVTHWTEESVHSTSQYLPRTIKHQKHYQ